MKIKHGGNIAEMAERYQLSLEKITDFSANINPLGIPEAVKQGLIKEINQLEHYPDSRYSKLKKAVAQAHHCQESHVYLGNGAAQVIFDLAQTLAPKRVLVLAPTFVEYEEAFSLTHAEFCYYLLESTHFQVEMDALIQQAKEQNVTCICLCNPNNPTGQLIPKKVLLKLVAFCQNESITLILDEAFMDFVQEAETASLVDQLDLYHNLYIIRSLTKVFAIPGLRLGYLLTANQSTLQILEQRKIPWSINSLADKAGQIALEESDYLAETLTYVAQERTFLLKEMEQHDVFTCYPSVTNFLFFQANCPFDLQEELLNKHFLIRSCHNFKGLTKHYFRIAVRTTAENQAFVQAVKELLDEKSLS